MIINSVGSAFTGNSGSGQNTGGTSNQTDPASEDTTASGSDQSGGSEASGSTGASSGSEESSGGQAGGQGGSEAVPSSAGSQTSSRTDTSTPATILSVEAEKPAVDEDALRTQALEVQKRLNTEMLIKSLGAAPETDLSLLGETETETPVPLAVAAYAENFKPAADAAKATA
ncbi:hypothetical protein [uncultured Hoeflea sp.]|uniref:hypothetical protein n=1 Tax=uncultured Hoeflea sp. TaxID=538666 RepID=UPI0030EB4FAA|tara:strand:+ start:120055 stop:120570 length:516 start_codon:yes stop_codon:yes gene_type:complete